MLCAGVWAISVPENNLKYTKFSGKYKNHIGKINKLISTLKNYLVELIYTLTSSAIETILTQ